MTEAPVNKVKVSREGVVLIKSFEGFRPRAERLPDGRWIIGYGHTASAREGVQVGEADAELLLQYDLIPVVRAIQQTIRTPLNQHQVDALASFAFSVGAEAFAQSPVAARLNAGDTAAAAEALVSVLHPSSHVAMDPIGRRRAAERALFLHAPDQPVALAALLTAPAPASPPPVADRRAQAVAALLGEVEPPYETLEASAPVETPEPAPTVVIETAPPPTPEDVAGPRPADPEATSADHATAMTNWQSSVSLTMQRYSPYAGRMSGPLPGLAPVAAPPHQHDETAPPAEPQAEPAAAAPDPESPPEASPVITRDADVGEGRLLVLTPPPEAPVEPPAREVWPEERRHPEPEDDSVLFGDELAPEESLQVLRHEEIVPENAGRFDWSETGAFLGMGAVGLVAFGASIAGFRLASGDIAAVAFNETTMVSWVLALIGALCVGVSAFNLYLRWGRRSDD